LRAGCRQTTAFLRVHMVMHTEFSPTAGPLTVKPGPQSSESSTSHTNIDSFATESDRTTAAAAIDEAEILQASIKAGSVAQIVIAVIAVIGLIYLLKLVMVTALFSILLAFVLEPLVGQVCRIRIPRAAAALLAVSLRPSTSPPSYQSIPAGYVWPWPTFGSRPIRLKRVPVPSLPRPTPVRHPWLSRFANRRVCCG
jgi:hypothetical protein